MLIVVACVAIVAVILGPAVFGDEPAEVPENLPPGPASAVDPTGARIREGMVRGSLPDDEVVRVRVGDVVELTVSSRRPDSVAIEELGLVKAVGPGAPARFSFLADRPGAYPVMLTISDERAGRIVVRAKPKREAGPRRRAPAGGDDPPEPEEAPATGSG